jgi:Fe-S-cluster-containing hydrogenase component 2
MTPQEKAKELIRKYYSIGAIECKNCALICVQEMIELLDEMPMDEEVIEQFAYLQQVKLELKNYIPTNNA